MKFCVEWKKCERKKARKRGREEGRENKMKSENIKIQKSHLTVQCSGQFYSKV